MIARHRRGVVPLALVVVCLAAEAPVARAQDAPTVFVHGLNSGPGAWAEAASRLEARVSITAHLASLPSLERVGDQADRLQEAGAALPPGTVAIGHSNGGLVAREWSRRRPLDAIVTLGTPHEGALLAERGLDLVNFNRLLYNYAGLAIGLGSGPSELGWVIQALQVYLTFARGLSADSIGALVSGLAITTAAPVLPEMAPGSPLLQSLNGADNLARESAATRHRIGLVFVAHDYWRAGPAVAFSPANRERIWNLMVGSVVALETAAAYVQQRYPPWDPSALSLVANLRALAGLIRDIDPQWCWAITNDRSCNTPHDGIVATASQRFPGGLNLGVNGPAHLQETTQSDDLLFDVLTRTVRLPLRGEARPVPPPPCCGGASGHGLVASQRLYADSEVSSPSGVYALRYQADGNLVLYREGGIALWSNGTAGESAGWTELQADGNLVTYDAEARPIWASGTHFYPGAHLAVQDDGFIVIYDAGGTPVWWVGGL